MKRKEFTATNATLPAQLEQPGSYKARLFSFTFREAQDNGRQLEWDNRLPELALTHLVQTNQGERRFTNSFSLMGYYREGEYSLKDSDVAERNGSRWVVVVAKSQKTGEEYTFRIPGSEKTNNAIERCYRLISQMTGVEFDQVPYAESDKELIEDEKTRVRDERESMIVQEVQKDLEPVLQNIISKQEKYQVNISSRDFGGNRKLVLRSFARYDVQQSEQQQEQVAQDASSLNGTDDIPF